VCKAALLHVLKLDADFLVAAAKAQLPKGNGENPEAYL